MLRRLRTSLVISLLIGMSFLAGCSAPGPKFTKAISPADGKAIIYVYRARFALTAGELPGVKLNDKVIVSSLPELNYFPIAVDPGHYTFTPKLFGIYGTTPGELTVEAGKTYFVWMRMEIGHIGFYQADPDEAMNYMSTCYLLNAGFAKDPRVLIGTAATAPAEAPQEETAPEAEKKAQQPAPLTAPAPASIQAAAEPVEAAPVITKTQLFIKPQPADANIRIMNIKPRFEQGIVLTPGRYKIDVSAPGYKNHVEWITLQKGEKREMQVVLEANQPKKVAVQPAPVPVSKPAPAPVVAPPKTEPVALKAPQNLSPEQQRCARHLQSDSATDIRTGAKSVYYRHSGNSYLTTLAEQVLLENYNENISDNMHIDAMAWLCKALARTGNDRYRNTLETVAQNSKNRKLRGYAAKSLRSL